MWSGSIKNRSSGFEGRKEKGRNRKEKMFEKLVAIEPVHLVDAGVKELKNYAKEVVLYDDIPADDAEIVRRIGDVDAVLVCYTSRITGETLAQCPNVKYVAMCCSLYSEASANVDIAYARAHGIDVRGIRDYGDRGVVEFVLCELVRFLHGYDRPMWKDQPQEITRLKTGIIGPSHEVDALKKWLSEGNNWFICDTAGAIGDASLVNDPHIVCEQASAGCTAQAYELLTEKVLTNIKEHLGC